MKKIVLMVCLTANSFLFAQSYQDSLKKEDEDIITSIAPYSPEVRSAILNVAQYSNKLVKIERIQSRTSQSFQDLLSPYPREEQEKFYELARYPELIHQLVSGPPKTAEQVKPLLTSYPQEVSTAVNALFPMKLADLTAMDKTYQNSQKSLDNMLSDLPDEVQADFKKVVAMPEVMNLLTEHIDLVVSLGDAYKNDPSGTKHKLDSLSGQIDAQNQKDLDDYKKQVANDPQMQEEMKKSAEDFADSYSSNGEGIPAQPNATSSNAPGQPQVVNNYYYGSNYNPNPYAYWFGYPYWYSYPAWYPYPLYYHTGFYIGAGGSLVVVGLPSRAYSGWFFSYGYHRYPRYYNYCNTYYSNRQVFVNRVNVYQGFNTHVNNHFSQVTRDVNINRNYNTNRNLNTARNMNNNINRNENTNREVNPNRNSNAFRNTIRQNGSINQRAYSNFNAAQFHQQNWGGGGFRPGGGGGGFHGGGGRGRR
ncbi:MAG: hypothetical protein JSS93_05950 [Bacteroidetes bacterium]|nr:hypothetical protein [Bacteroidota bacterium]